MLWVHRAGLQSPWHGNPLQSTDCVRWKQHSVSFSCIPKCNLTICFICSCLCAPALVLCAGRWESSVGTSSFCDTKGSCLGSQVSLYRESVGECPLGLARQGPLHFCQAERKDDERSENADWFHWGGICYLQKWLNAISIHQFCWTLLRDLLPVIRKQNKTKTKQQQQNTGKWTAGESPGHLSYVSDHNSLYKRLPRTTEITAHVNIIF